MRSVQSTGEASDEERWVDPYGLTIPLTGMPLHAQRDLIAELPTLGYTDVWSSESNGADAFTPLALASAWAPELRLGTAVVPAFTRGAATLAISAASLADAAPGRVLVGIGSSSDVVVRNWNGIEFDRPYQRVRDVVHFLREALTGAKVTRAYETFTVDGFRLAQAPEVAPQILVAALRPGMLALAGREADGAILNWLAPGDVPKVTPYVHNGGSGKTIVARIFVVPTADAELARRVGRMLIAGYLTVPVYRAFHEWLGRGSALAGMWQAWQAGDRKGALAAIPDEVVDDLIVHGTPQQCRDRIRQYVDAGVHTPVLALATVDGDVLDQVRALAPSAPGSAASGGPR